MGLITTDLEKRDTGWYWKCDRFYKQWRPIDTLFMHEYLGASNAYEYLVKIPVKDRPDQKYHFTVNDYELVKVELVTDDGDDVGSTVVELNKLSFEAVYA